jgi:hypothetical protein
MTPEFNLSRRDDMSNARPSTILIAAILSAAGAAQAAGTFPVSVPDVPAAWYADRIERRVDASPTLATQSPFPSAAREHGTAHDTAQTSSAVAPSIARGLTLGFPTSINETGPVL